MGYQFSHHYSIEEARQLLPSIREWLQSLNDEMDRLRLCDIKLKHLMADGDDVGGEAVHDRLKAFCVIRRILKEFKQREIQVKDLERGLIDFPAIVGGREVFLCWESDEEEIEFWHDLDTGYSGREPLH